MSQRLIDLLYSDFDDARDESMFDRVCASLRPDVNGSESTKVNYRELPLSTKQLIRCVLYDHLPDEIENEVEEVESWLSLMHSVSWQLPVNFRSVLYRYINTRPGSLQRLAPYVPWYGGHRLKDKLRFIGLHFRQEASKSLREIQQYITEYKRDHPLGRLYLAVWRFLHDPNATPVEVVDVCLKNVELYKEPISADTAGEFVKEELAETAVEIFRANWAESGHAFSMVRFASATLYGFGTKKDPKLARMLYWECYEKTKCPYSLNEFAFCLQQGVGGGKDEKQARELYLRVWEHSMLPMGLHNFAFCLMNGLGGRKMEKIGLAFFKRNAYENKHGGSLFEYALALEQGRGTVAKPGRARKLYKRCWKTYKNKNALDCFVRCLLYGIGGEVDTAQANALSHLLS